MNLTDTQIDLVDKLYRDASLNLLTPAALNKYLKENGHTGYTINKIKDYINSLQTTQTSKLHYSNHSYVAEGPREQYQLDLIYMPDSWHNHNYKYLLSVVDVFSKVGDLKPLKDREKKTVALAFEQVIHDMGTPKTVFTDKGSEFKNSEFQKVLDNHKIQIIFALNHAAFVEAFNKTMKNRLIKYMKLNNDKNWAKFIGPVLQGYNNTKHSATGIAPNNVSSKNEIEVAMKLKSHAKTSNYPIVSVGDMVRLPIIHKVHKQYKEQWTTELYKVQEVYHNGVYKVNNELHPRRDLQLVKGDVIKLPEKSKQEQVMIAKQDKIGKAANKPIVKQLMNTKTPDYQAVETMLDSGRTKRPTSGPTDYAKFAGVNHRTKK